MKKLLLSLLVIAGLSMAASAQMFELYHGEEFLPMGSTFEVQGYPDEFEIVSHITLKNISNQEVVVKCRKMEVDVLANTSNTFCWGLCYAPSVFVSPLTITIAAGDTTQEFSGHYMPGGNEGITKMCYSFFDESNPNDSTYFYVNYNGTYSVGIDDPVAESAFVSHPYPNPASSMVSFDYQFPAGTSTAKINIHNLLGAKVKEINIPGFEGKVSFNVQDLKDGIYFYSVNVNNEIIETKRLVISR
jgi:hypothetical protein